MTATEIVQTFAAGVKSLSERVDQDQVTALEDLVALVQPVLWEAGRQLVAALHGQAQARQPRPFCEHCHQPLRGHGHCPRSVVTALGEVRLELRRYRCVGCGRCVEPGLWDSDLRGCCSREVWELATELATALPYRRVEELLGRLGMPLSDDLVQDLVRRVGGQLSQAQRATATAVAEGRVTLRPRRPPARLYLLVDGRMVRVDGEWRELKVAVMFETAVAEPDHQGRLPPVERVSSFACLGTADEFMERLFAAAQRRGVWDAAEVVLLADGAPWIWERLPQFVPCGVPRVEILDYYHAAEHVQEAVEAVLGGPSGSFVGRRLRDWLRAGELDEVLHQLRRLHAQTATDEAAKTVRRTIEYLRRHRQRLQYFRRHWEGYYIGSGQVESLCKHLGLRLKGCGMNWSAEGLEALLSIYNHLRSHEPQPLPRAA